MFGTDGEKELVNAFKHEFSFAQHLTFSIHICRNIKEKFNECSIPTTIANEVLNDILSVKIGTTYVEGLADASDINDFDIKVGKLVTTWRNLEITSTGDMDRFIHWFEVHKAPVIRRSMLRDIGEKGSLGSHLITTKASETTNYMLKSKVNFKKQITRIPQPIKGNY